MLEFSENWSVELKTGINMKHFLERLKVSEFEKKTQTESELQSLEDVKVK